MRPENVQAAITALYAYAEAARADSLPLDSEILQLDLEEISCALESDTPVTAERLLRYLGITKTEHGYKWGDHR